MAIASWVVVITADTLDAFTEPTRAGGEARAMRRKQLQRGRDWHAYAYREIGLWHGRPRPFHHYAQVRPDPPNTPGLETGEWVRVKFVAVDDPKVEEP